MRQAASGYCLMEEIREIYMYINKKIKISSVIFFCFIIFTWYVHINLLEVYNINKIPTIKSLEESASNYYSAFSDEKTYDDIFIVKGSQYFIDVDENTYNYALLEDFRNTYLTCKSDKKCIDSFNKQKMIENIVNSWTNYYEDFKPSK